MKSNGGFIDLDDLRMEIAFLLEDIDANNPGIAKFSIPVLSTEDNTGTYITNNNNIINDIKGNSAVAVVKIDNYIELRVPKEYTVFYGADTIPAGTRFIVAFIGGNVNDIKIIGRYDSIEDMEDK